MTTPSPGRPESQSFGSPPTRGAPPGPAPGPGRTSDASASPPVIIVGAGIAGLTCAVYLRRAGIDALLLEAADGVGGRVRTDVVDGFRLDRGFQILLTAYPEARRLLDYDALNLRLFRSGALIHKPEPDWTNESTNDQWIKLLNPLREPLSAFTTLTSPFGTLTDKLRVVNLLRQTQSLSVDELFQQTPTTTRAFLHERGFSDQIIERFFRPFFGGVFLEDALTTSSNFFEFCFRMFFVGDAAVPARGIGAIAEQLASRLSPEQIRLKTLVQAVEGNAVRLDSGETLTGRAVVLAVDAAQAALLTKQQAKPIPVQAFNHTTCTYFAASSSPNVQKLLMLNPDRRSVVHNLAVMSDVSPDYAPANPGDYTGDDAASRPKLQTLVSVSTQGLETVNEAALAERIQRELLDWFGNDVKTWRHLRTYHLPHALPAYGPEQAGTSYLRQPLRLTETLYQCGDHTAYPSLNAAMQTGREVATLIIVRSKG